MTRIELAGSGDLDLYDNLPLSLSFSIVDIEKPDTRTGAFSQTITLPGTHNNNDLLKHVYEINSYSDFNPNNRAKVYVYKEDIFILEGYLKLSKINIDNEKIEYEVVIYAGNTGLFIDIGDGLLSDLDYSDLNHDYNYTNIRNSWNAPIGDGYYYPAILYGVEPQSWKVSDFRPALYLKEYIDRIFSEAKYTYTSPFFNSEYFKMLIIPHSGGALKLKNENLQERETKIIRNTNVVYTTATPNPQKVTFTFTEINTINTVLNSEITIARSGLYTINSTVWAQVDSIINIAGFPNNFFAVANLEVRSSKGMTLLNWILKYEATTAQGLIGSGVTQKVDVQLDAGETIYLVLNMSNRTGGGVRTTINNAYLNVYAAAGYVGLQQIVINDIVNRKIKQKDLLMSVIKMFNLYVDIDTNKKNNYIIEPRDDFYSSGTVVDWSLKLDESKGLDIVPTTDVINKKYKFTYKSDTDYLNDLYQTRYSNEVYGQKVYEVEGDLTKGERVVDIIFSPTSIKAGYTWKYSAIQNKSNPGNLNLSEYNLRLLFAYPKQTTFKGTAVAAGIIAKSFLFENIYQDYFPYAGHLDDPDTPYRDLSFGVPQEVYYTALKYTNQNLFNLFHKTGIVEMTDPNARIVTGYFLLNPIDINSLDFRNIYYFKNYYMRLLKIENYDLNNRVPVKCTFLKLKIKDIPDSSNFTVIQPTNYGGVNNAL
jgi:hypothetical protein